MKITQDKFLFSARVAAVSLGSAWILWHFFATFVYLVPSNLISRSYDKYVMGYMFPVFRQNWHLFSPNPGFSDVSLWIRCYKNTGEVSEWMDPFKKLTETHHKTRLTGVGKLLYVYNNLPKEIVAEDNKASEYISRACLTNHEKALRDDLKSVLGSSLDLPSDSLCDPGNSLLLRRALIRTSKSIEYPNRFAAYFCGAYAESGLLGFQIRVIEKMPKKFSERNTPALYGQVTSLTLDPVLTKSREKIKP